MLGSWDRLQAMGAFEALVPVLKPGLFRPDRIGSKPQDFFLQTIVSLNACAVMVEAGDHGIDLRIHFQDMGGSISGCGTESHIAVFLPVLLMQRNIGQHINRGLKHIQPVAFPDVVKAVIGIAAVHVALESAVRVGASFMGMAGNPIFVHTHKDRIVILRIFIEQASPDKGIHNLPIQKPSFQKIRINPPHILILFWKGKGLFLLGWCVLLWEDNNALLLQEKLHGLREVQAIKLSGKGNGIAAFRIILIEPEIPPDRDFFSTMVPFVFRSGSFHLLTLSKKERPQICAAGLIFLFFCNMDISRSHEASFLSPVLNHGPVSFHRSYASAFGLSHPYRLCARPRSGSG